MPFGLTERRCTPLCKQRPASPSAGVLTQHFFPAPTGPDARLLAGLQRGRFYLLQSGRSAPDEARSDWRTRAPCPCQTARVKKMPLLLSRAIFFSACHSLRLVTLVCRVVICCCITMQIYQHMRVQPAAAVRKIVGLGQEMTFQ